MTHRTFAIYVALAGTAALVFNANGAFAQSAPSHSGMHAPSHGRFMSRHDRRTGLSGFWPVTGQDELLLAPARPAGNERFSGDMHYTYTYDAPWDWVHRLPPVLTPSGRPYVPSCSTESQTVSGHRGEQTVNVMRCY